MKTGLLTAAAALLLTAACGGRSADKGSAAPAEPDIVAAAFDADSAYAAVKAQVDMGPRNPGSPGHTAIIGWLQNELKRRGADTVAIQRGEIDGVGLTNITGSFNPSAKTRVLLAAHYDTRPWADEDPDEANHSKPLPGANDGASGVGVLLEIARQLGLDRPEIGVDLLFVDVEDSGDSGDNESWCKGSQFWARNIPYSADAMPRYAILLDMVGGAGARFNREYMSLGQAGAVVDKVWAIGRAIGYADIFVNDPGGPVVDDHIFIGQAGIPAIDIIECNNAATGTFPPYWHTMADDMTAISAKTLGAVGTTVLTTLRREKP